MLFHFSLLWAIQQESCCFVVILVFIEEALLYQDYGNHFNVLRFLISEYQLLVIFILHLHFVLQRFGLAVVLNSVFDILRLKRQQFVITSESMIVTGECFVLYFYLNNWEPSLCFIVYHDLWIDWMSCIVYWRTHKNGIRPIFDTPNLQSSADVTIHRFNLFAFHWASRWTETILGNRGKCIEIGSMESINIRMVVLHDSVQENLFDHSLSFLFDVDGCKGQFLRVQVVLK